LWRDAHDEGGLTWDDASNNKAFLGGAISATNNGFYATTRKSGSQGHRPVLRVTTRELGDAVELRMRDNGTGIRQSIGKGCFSLSSRQNRPARGPASASRSAMTLSPSSTAARLRSTARSASFQSSSCDCRAAIHKDRRQPDSSAMRGDTALRDRNVSINLKNY
jgi:hypothetical protein